MSKKGTGALLEQFCFLQVATTEEVILFKGLSPLQYAEQIWKSLAGEKAIMTPLDGLVSSEDLDRSVKPLYLEHAQTMAESWVTDQGISNPYTMLWAKALK